MSNKDGPTAENTLRMKALCSIQSEGRPMSDKGSVQYERQSNCEPNVFSSKWAIKMGASVA